MRKARATGWLAQSIVAAQSIASIASIAVALLIAVGACRDPVPPAPPTSSTARAASAGAPRAAPPQAGSPRTAEARLYRIELVAPTAVAPGEKATATVSVTPLPPYKINLEYPVRLVVRAPAPIAPAELRMGPGDAATFTVKELLLRPSFTLPAAGEYPLAGELRFSVCTDSQCELATEAVRWRASAK
ncbi:MAG: hypothetical protein IPL40_13260 [Proteobacteria bacterium]|nr:hypothetical protein [Pseudomonadota bacterium]